MDPSVLTVYTPPYAKKRLGKRYDGGYIIIDVPDVQYSILLSAGIGKDISFEEDFIKKYNIQCLAFDGTIQSLVKENTNIEFFKKNISPETTDKTTNLHEIINKYEDIFLKMDIEGSEKPWIKSLTEEQINKFAQIVIEFHCPFAVDEAEIFEKMNKNHFLVHFHPNNCCNTRIHKGVVIPNLFECTYLHKKYFKSQPELNTDMIPSKLDMKNLKYNEDIFINHPPFVNLPF